MKIQKKKLSHEVLDRLRERIHSGEFSLGDHLPSERELMEHYGVGRPAIREAMQTLEREGILEISHGERARIVTPTAKELIRQIAGGAKHLLRTQPGTLENVKEARLFLETGMARIAAQTADKDDVVRLQMRLADQHAAISNQQQFIRCDMAFHREIATISGNPIFPAIVEALFDWASEHYVSSVIASGAETVTLSEHQRILDAISRGDPEAAAQAMTEHLTRSSALYQLVNHPQRDAR